MSSRIQLFLGKILFALVITASVITPSLSQATEPGRDAAEQQVAILKGLDPAVRNFDFDRQVSILERLRQLAVQHENSPMPLAINEIDFIRRSILVSKDKFRTDPETAKNQLIERNRGLDCAISGDFCRAIEHYTKSLQLSNDLYGEASYQSLDILLKLTTAYPYCNDDEAHGIACGVKARQTLRSLQLTQSYQYLTVLAALSTMQYKQGDYAAAVESGRVALDLYPKRGLDKSPAYFLMSGLLAESLNKEGKSKEALNCATEALAKDPPKRGQFAPFYFRLLQQFAEANVKLEHFKEADTAYKEIIAISDTLPGYPVDLRVSYREAYLAVLKISGDEKQLAKVEGEIAQLKGDTPLKRSRYTR